MKSSLILLCVLCLASCKSSRISDKSHHEYWQNKKLKSEDINLPDVHRGLTLDLELLKSDIESTSKVTIPLPDGTNVKVLLEKSNVMSDKLAEKYPDIKSFRIIEENDVKGSIDMNASGFYAMIIKNSDTYFINPVKTGSENYVSYHKKYAVRDGNNPFIDKVIK